MTVATPSLIRRAWLELGIAMAVVLGVALGAQFFTSSFEKSKATALAENARLRGDAEALRAARERTSRKFWAYLVTGSTRDLASAREAQDLFLDLLDRQGQDEVEMAETFARLRALAAKHGELTTRLTPEIRDTPEGFRLQIQLQPVIDELDALLSEVIETRRARVERARAELIAASQAGIVVFALAALAGLFTAGILGFSLVRRVRAELRLRDQAAQSERMAALGTLSAGVAHEIKNPLSYVAANLRFIERLLSAGSPSPETLTDVREAVTDACNGATRIQTIIDDMSRFSRGEPPSQTGADVRDAVEWAARVSRKQIEQKARLRLDHGEVSPVRGDATRLGQVILNLLLNAADAIPPGAVAKNEIAVTTRPVAEGVEILVRDTGTGMSDEVVERLFEPFFTTKGPGKGTGLGLAISRGYVQEIGGALQVTSVVGQGTTFRIRLPKFAATSSPTKISVA